MQQKGRERLSAGGSERSPHLELAHVDGGCEEFIIVDGTRGVHINALHELFHLFLGDGAALLCQPFPQLVQCDGATLVYIQCLQTPGVSAMLQLRKCQALICCLC